MNNLRNNGFNESAPIVSEEFRRTDIGFGEKHVLHDNGGLSSFHHFEEKEEGSSQGKLIGGALVVALLLGAAGLYAYTGSAPAPASKAPASAVASNMPATPIQTAPVPPPAATPAPEATSGTTAKSPYDAQPSASPAPAGNTASMAPDVKAQKPVKSARAPVAKDEAARNQAEAAQTAELNGNGAADRATRDGSVTVPLPPAPPASSVASNGQTISPTPEASTSQDMPVPAATPDQQPAVTPAPTTTQPDQAASSPAQPQ